MNDKINKGVSFSNSGTYHIRVLGNVCQELWDYFDGETEQVEEDNNGQITTSLRMHVRDQTELSGLIRMLYDWHLVILAVIIEGINDNKEA